MARLTSTLSINLEDRVSGPAAALRRNVNALRRDLQRPFVSGAINLGRQLEQEAVRVRNAARNVATSLSPAAFGLGALIHQTQEYEKAFYGVKASMIADNMDTKIENGITRNVVNLGKVRSAANLAKGEVEKLSRELMMRPTAVMKAWEAVGKAGVPYSLDGLSPEQKAAKLQASQRTLVEMASEVHRQDTELPIDKVAELLHTLGINFKAGERQFERGTGNGSYDDDVAKIANQLLYVANATKTSAGGLASSLKQFAALFGNLGNSFGESAALAGALVQGGLDPIEGGTAMKSMAVRFIKNFTSEGRDAWLAAGLNRADFTNETAVSGKKAATTLGGLTDKQLSKEQKEELKAHFLKAEKAGRMNDPAFVAETAKLYNRITGARDQATRDRNLDRVRMALFSAGNEINMFKLFRALSLKMGKMGEADREKSLDAWGMGELGAQAQAEVKRKLDAGTLTQSQMAVIGEGRHLSRYNALLALFGTAEELEKRARSLNNREMTTAGRDLAKDDQYWKFEGAMGRMEAAFNKLRESEGVVRFLDGLASIADKLSTANPALVEMAGNILVLSAIGAPVALAITGIVSALTVFRVGLALLFSPLAKIGALVKWLRTMALAAMIAGAPVAAGTGAAVAGGAAAGGVLAGAKRVGNMLVKGGKVVGRVIPGVGLVATVGIGGYGAYQGYKKDGTVSGAFWGGLDALNPFSSSGASAAPASPSPAQTVVAAGQAVAGAGSGDPMAYAAAARQAQGEATGAMRSTVDQVRAIVGSVDLTSEGYRLMSTLAAGIRSGSSLVGEAVGDAMSQQVRGAVRGQFSDGGLR